MGNGKSRVLIVDDSAVFRHALTDVLRTDPRIEVVGTAANGKLALEMLDRLKPDLITLDVEMPVMDGLTTVSEIRKRTRTIPVLMFSTLTSRGADATLEALQRGASDYCAKPSSNGAGMEELKNDLLPKVRALLKLDRSPAVAQVAMRRATGVATPAAAGPVPRKIDIVAIGCSTGGPNALADVIPRLPPNFATPIVIVQHMPPVFTKLLAERLSSRSKVKVCEATDGQLIENGVAYIAPGDFHMVLQRNGLQVRLKLNKDPAENFCRPAVDPMMRSVATTFPGSALGVILTGMGRDGTLGCDHLRKSGSYILGQDEETSVVWGMPGSIAEKGLANEILPLPRIADAIVRWVARGRTGAPADVRDPKLGIKT